MSVAAVLLDAGGVLIDPDFAAVGRIVAAHATPVAPDRLRDAEAQARRDLNRSLTRRALPDDPWRAHFADLLRRVGVPDRAGPAILDDLWEEHHAHGLWVAPAPGAREALDALASRGLRLAVVSNAEGQVARDLDRAGYAGRFETVVDSHLVGVAKPDPAIFAVALERLGLTAEDVVFVGDMPEIDVRGARAAGIRPILVDRFDLHPGADCPRISSMRELPARIPV